MRPGNGATNVPANTLVTLFTNTAMNPATVTGALHVTDNGVVVSGSVQLFSNAQAIEFTPGASFNPGDLIQVFLDPTALSARQCRVVELLGTVHRGRIARQYGGRCAGDQPVLWRHQRAAEHRHPAGVQPATDGQHGQQHERDPLPVQHRNLPDSDGVAGRHGQVINIAPTSNLASGSQYQVCVIQRHQHRRRGGAELLLVLHRGYGRDNAAPTIVSQAPTDNSTNIGTNAYVSVNFNKAINPISVTGSTIQLSAGATTEVPSSISFSPDYTRVSIVPQAPLPPSTLMTIAINGVTSEAGVAGR